MRILLADTDQTLCMKLEHEGFVVEGCTDALETIAYLTTLQFDAVLIVCPLTGAVPARLVQDIRRERVAAPIIMQGTFDGLETIKLLALGADDVVGHGVLADEVVARIRAVIRRAAGRPSALITVGNVTIDLNTKTAEANGQAVHLTGKEYALLELLMLRKGLTLTKEVILQQLYNDRDEPEVKIIDVFICKLRKKLADAGVSDFVGTVWGRGYVVGRQTVAAELADLNYGGLNRDQLFDETIRLAGSPSLAPALDVA